MGVKLKKKSIVTSIYPKNYSITKECVGFLSHKEDNNYNIKRCDFFRQINYFILLFIND